MVPTNVGRRPVQVQRPPGLSPGVLKPSAKKWTPTGNYVQFWVEKPHDKTDGGVIIPETSRDQYTTPVGRVIAVGPECEHVTPGDRILVHMDTALVKVLYDGDESFVTSEDRIIGVIDETPVAE